MTDEPRESAAASAAERVRTIVEAAERAAADLEAAAREEADRIQADAKRDAARACEVVKGLRKRADELEGRLGELMETVRSSVTALEQELASLREAAEPTREGAGAAGAAPAPSRDAGAEPARDAAESTPEPEAAAEPAPEPEAAQPAPAPQPDVDEALIAEAEAAAARPPDVESAPDAPEGARLLALKMALDGAPREATARYLQENFELEDPDGLLDEVYAKAGR